MALGKTVLTGTFLLMKVALLFLPKDVSISSIPDVGQPANTSTSTVASAIRQPTSTRQVAPGDMPRETPGELPTLPMAGSQLLSIPDTADVTRCCWHKRPSRKAGC